MTHAPALMPDEDLRGYWGRVLRLNAVPTDQCSEERFRAQVRCKHGLRDPGRSNVAEAICAIANIDLATLLRAHSLVPLHGAVAGSVVAVDWRDISARPWKLQQFTMNQQRHSVHGCAGCVQEDLDFWGFTYWRRTHLIPGVLRCAKHNRPLFRVEQLPTWQLMPHEAPVSSGGSRWERLTQALETPVLLRYAHVCLELLTRPRPMSTVQVVHVLNERAAVLGLDLGSRTPLSDLAKTQLTGPWQAMLLSGRERKAQASPFCIDSTLNRMMPVIDGTDYAIAIAVLYDSPDEGLRELLTAASTAAALLADLQKQSRGIFRSTAGNDPASPSAQAYAEAAANFLSGASFLQAAKLAGVYSPGLEKFLRQQACVPRPNIIGSPDSIRSARRLPPKASTGPARY